MATIAEPRVRPAEGERRFVIYNVGWGGYQTLLKLLGDHGPRLTYDRGNVELMSPLIIHERFKKLFARMVETITEELDIPMVAAGATTFNAELLDRGLEPDECYYLTNAARLRDTDRIDLTIDPPPDLAIEVEITSSLLDKLGVYAALGVPEIWRFDGETLTVLLLRPDGTYAPGASSAAFPFLPMNEILRSLLGYDVNNDTRWGRAFRAWVRAEIAPRLRGAAGGAGPP
jgi:Uma2 family endonuclease